MLFLLFELGPDRYVLPATQIARVLPLVHLRAIPHAPHELAGLFDYHGASVPVIDVSLLATGRPAAWTLSTRIVLVGCGSRPDSEHLLGLIVERATRTIRRDVKDFAPSGVSHGEAPYLGPVLSDQGGLIQWIDVEKILPASLREVLFTEPAATP